MNDYKNYIRRSMGLTEAQFIPASLLEKDEIDPDELEKGTEDEKDEHGMPIKKAELTAKQHLEAPNQGHYYTGMEKAKKDGMLKDQAMSPTAIPTPIIAVGIRGSVTGGLPSGADQQGDISPTKVGGYDRVEPQNLNHHTFDKTPSNPEIKQPTPINPTPSTGQGVTHPHQIQVTAHEEPQSVTGASTDSDPTLKLKSAMPKGIDIDIAETGNTQKAEEDETKNEDNNTAMIPSTSLSETFERHKRLMREKIGLTEGKCPCGCEGTCQCQPGCKCKKNRNGICECATCGCGDPTDTHGHGTPENKPEEKSSGTQTVGKKKYFDPKTKTTKDVDWVSMKEGKTIDQREDEMVECKSCHNPLNYRLVAEVSMGAVKCPACDAVLDQNGTVLAEGKHKAGCQCGFCKNKGIFGKKKKEVAEGDEADSMSDQDQELQADRDFGKDKDSKKDKKTKKDKAEKQQRIDESYAVPFQRMRSLAGVGNMILTSNGLFENKNDPGANKPFNTNWKMDKEKAGFVKIDEEKLTKIKKTLERKSKRGTLSDKELQLAKKLNEVLKRRQLKEGKEGQKCRIKGCNGKVKSPLETRAGLGGLCATHVQSQQDRERQSGEHSKMINWIHTGKHELPK